MAMEDDRPAPRFSLGAALRAQDWASVAALTPAIVALAVTYHTNPTDRPFAVYDATLSYPYFSSSSIPYWVVIVVGVACLLISFAVGEVVARRRLNTSTTAAVASFLHFTIDVVCVWITTVLLTNVFKLLLGRYRPDWLDRCQPVIPSPLNITIGQPTSLNAACTSGASASEIKDGHQAFPSGHASTAFAFGVYGAYYCIWAAYWRPARRYEAETGPKRAWRVRAVEDITSTAVFYWALFQLSWAWGVAVSRVMDYKHSPADVVGGAFLGATVGLLFVLRAIPRHYRLMPRPPVHQALLDAAADAEMSPPREREIHPLPA